MPDTPESTGLTAPGTTRLVATPPDAWASLRAFTPARIGLGRSGVSQPTGALLEFSLAHAQARDAVHTALDTASLAGELALAGFEPLHFHSQAADRSHYLRRPDLGRRLNSLSQERLRAASRGASAPADLVFVLADGLSALAITRHALPVLIAAREQLQGWSIGPVVVAEQSRVALGDEVGELLGARAVDLLVGERPGLSAPDSLGIYLTWSPKVGRTDAERNCISNIRPEGLSYEQAAHTLAGLLQGARRLGSTGVGLKDEQPNARLTE